MTTSSFRGPRELTAKPLTSWGSGAPWRPNYDGWTRDPIPTLSQTETRRPAGRNASGPSVLLDMRPLQGPSARRGIGSYARGLLHGLIEEGFDRNLTLLLDSGLPVPPLPVAEYRLASSRRRYRGQLAAYEDAVVLGYDLARSGRRRVQGQTGSARSGAPALGSEARISAFRRFPGRQKGPAIAAARLAYRDLRRAGSRARDRG